MRVCGARTWYGLLVLGSWCEYMHEFMRGICRCLYAGNGFKARGPKHGRRTVNIHLLWGPSNNHLFAFNAKHSSALWINELLFWCVWEGPLKQLWLQRAFGVLFPGDGIIYRASFESSVAGAKEIQLSLPAFVQEPLSLGARRLGLLSQGPVRGMILIPERQRLNLEMDVWRALRTEHSFETIAKKESGGLWVFFTACARFKWRSWLGGAIIG